MAQDPLLTPFTTPKPKEDAARATEEVAELKKKVARLKKLLALVRHARPRRQGDVTGAEGRRPYIPCLAPSKGGAGPTRSSLH